MKPISLSPSKLNLYLESKQCFWDAFNVHGFKVARPRGIFPSLPGGMDLILKAFVDQFRGTLPPNLLGRIPGVLWNDAQIERWRNWRTGPTYKNTEHQIELIGALDDMLELADDTFAPLDWKTKGSEPKDDGSQYYLNQMDCYELMAGVNGLAMSGFAWLCYVYPIQVMLGQTFDNKTSLQIEFGMSPYRLETDKRRAEETVIKAAECLRGPRPKDPEPTNEYWTYFQNKKLIENQEVAV